MDYKQRARNFVQLRDNKPEIGSMLVAKNGDEVPLYTQYKWDPEVEEETRIIFANAAIDEEATGWYLTDGGRGLKCLILPGSQDVLVKRNNGMSNGLAAHKLRVLRHTPTGSALICEVIYE